MDGQASHFGEDLFLGPSAVEEIGAFLLKNAAEQVLTEAAWKIDRSIPAAETPLRITETAYWINKHREIPDNVWEHPMVNGGSAAEPATWMPRPARSKTRRCVFRMSLKQHQSANRARQ